MPGGQSLPRRARRLPFSPRGHPPFLLPRQGEETEEEREIPPPGVRGTHSALAACGDTAQSNPLPLLTPPQFNSWG